MKFTGGLRKLLGDVRDHPEIGTLDANTGLRWMMLHSTPYKLWWNVVDGVAEPVLLRLATRLDLGLGRIAAPRK